MARHIAEKPTIGLVRALLLRRKLHRTLDASVRTALRSLSLEPGEARLNRKVQNANALKALVTILVGRAEVQGFFIWNQRELARLGVGAQHTRIWVSRSIGRVHRSALDQRDMLTPARVA